MSRVGVVRFLGTNCDRDIIQAAREFGAKAEFLWFQDQFNIDDYDAVVLPGGFSYGDYLRTGALSARTPVMKSVREFSQKGKPVLGICNGFQILCESGLLPGVLMRNQNMKFIDQWEELEILDNKNPWTQKYSVGQKIKLPIAHGEGRFFAENDTVKKIRDNNQILATYTNNPNGSAYDIAGITNDKKNVVGLMPHPERALYDWMGSSLGKGFFSWL
ncbi:MAG: phosphoribosylformylglycinamidine synthase subunit PurQ [Bdellovibrionota bacterium]